ncbi:MAG TPA: L-threonylcarbamoyladenylate synthase [Fimbriimonas sp.]|nr:L-threonylcarbamoyladenylate synthase [Fimbriimonas sp.]
MRILHPNDQAISEAAEALRSGKLVGMPTETVYGIAASALDESAVRRTFEIKGRPADNPLIIHVPSLFAALDVAEGMPDFAHELASRFWPGPLTLVLPKRSHVSDLVTGGLPTVAVRVPKNVVAQQLLEAAGVPVSAPSANRFMGISPTSAEDIDLAIAEELELILNGGPTEFGIESTVVDCTMSTPRILRPGALSRERIEAVVGRPTGREKVRQRLSPGMYRRHYSPKTPLRIAERLERGEKGLRLSGPTGPGQVLMPSNPEDYAKRLYAELIDLDGQVEEIIVEAPPQTPAWEAVWDRLNKAASKLQEP